MKISRYPGATGTASGPGLGRHTGGSVPAPGLPPLRESCLPSHRGHPEPATRRHPPRFKCVGTQSLLDPDHQVSSCARFFGRAVPASLSPQASCKSLNWRSCCSRTASPPQNVLHPTLTVIDAAPDRRRRRPSRRLASDTGALPWMMPSTCADLRRAIQRLIPVPHYPVHPFLPLQAILSRKSLDQGSHQDQKSCFLLLA